MKEINYFVAKYDRSIDWYLELFKDAAALADNVRCVARNIS